jgi:hypothetical protein
MSLKDQQKQLAQLYVDAEFRKKFLETNTTLLDSNEVEVFALGLLMKRLNAVKALLPISFQLNGPFLYEKFMLYGNSQRIQGAHLKHSLDALKFIRFLEHCELDSYQRQVLEWEEFRLEKSLPRSYFKVKKFSYDFDKATTDQILSNKTKQKFSVVLIWRVHLKDSWKILRW